MTAVGFQNQMITLSAINIYPVKSMAGISLEQSVLDRFGLVNDRRWMVVQPDGTFITQRTRPEMALIRPYFDDEALVLTHPVMDECRVQVANSEVVIRVRVWEDDIDALHISHAVDDWLSKALGEQCHMVWFPHDGVRQCDLDYARQGDKTAFADGFPLLLISQSSLGDLNSRLTAPVPMERFRPNLVVSGCHAFAEDEWSRICIGDALFRVVKPCSRCIMTTVDPQTGRRTGSEPLQTLGTYRKQGSKVYFGQNLVHETPGLLKIGDHLEVFSPPSSAGFE